MTELEGRTRSDSLRRVNDGSREGREGKGR